MNKHTPPTEFSAADKKAPKKSSESAFPTVQIARLKAELSDLESRRAEALEAYAAAERELIGLRAENENLKQGLALLGVSTQTLLSRAGALQKENDQINETLSMVEPLAAAVTDLARNVAGQAPQGYRAGYLDGLKRAQTIVMENQWLLGIVVAGKLVMEAKKFAHS